MPDLVVSGINKGYNLGDDVTYSGTVAGAWKQRCSEFPASRSRSNGRSTLRFSAAAAAGAQVPPLVLPHGLTPRTFLNINVPSGTTQGHARHLPGQAQPRDRRRCPHRSASSTPHYWIEEGEDAWEPHDRSDYQAVKDGYVSVTPLQPDDGVDQ